MKPTQPTSSLRIVSLLPSATEIVCRLGLKGNLVGLSHECDFPEDLSHLPRLTQPRIDPNLRGEAIHKDLSLLIKNGLSIYDVNVELLASLAPDWILTQDQCKVCAVSVEDVEKALCQLAQSQTQICTLSPHCLDDIHRDFLKVGTALNKVQEAKDLITEFWIKLNQINSKVGTDLPGRPRVLCLEWLEPLMVGGGWIPELVKLAGGEPLIVSKAEKFKTISWDEVVQSDPDIVVIFPCGYPMSKTQNEIETSTELKQLRSLRAFRQNKIFICDGNQFFNRPGPRIIDSCEILASLLFPEKFSSATSCYLGKAFIPWRPYEN
ncbi:MAG: cobalamin-binding protein [Deltaproteobacteria bacterium]